MKILKRNQIIISVIALMLITVGYMNYTSNITSTVETGALMDAEQMAGIGDAKLVSSNKVVENDGGSTESLNNVEESDSVDTTESSVNNEQDSLSSELKEKIGVSVSTQNGTTSGRSSQSTQETSTNSYNTEYFVSSRLERDKMYSQMVETYQNLLESSSISEEQKSISTQEITNINNTKNSIMIAENLIKNLGFEDVVIFVNDNSTSVIVKAEKLEEADIAQIQNIVCREIGVNAEVMHISVK